ncbi:MAG: GNAT family N-acetyltransferase [Chloroflexi bacterium]|nr:GNAT family N-acetyltransferase [Chloroflexota bacterium]
MRVAEYRRDSYLISTDKSKLDVGLIHDFLVNVSYWAQGRTLATVQMSIEHSLCFGLYGDDRQVGFCRVVTDYATFAWLCDVFILDERRGRGLGKWLIECVTSHPDLKTVPRWLLATRDAHGLYSQFGFQSLEGPERWMARIRPS